MFVNAVRQLSFLTLVLTLGCEQPPLDYEESEVTVPAAGTVDGAASKADVEEDFKTWSLGQQVEFSAWASGDNHVGDTTYIWGYLGKGNDYFDGSISFKVRNPDGTTTDTIQMEKQELEEAGNPNYGNTFTPKQAGRHRVLFRVTPNGQQEQQLGGLIFDVD